MLDDAVDTWREFAEPVWVDEGLVVVPAWQRHCFGDEVVAIAIEPGGAFGLGDHPTTLLSLRSARRHLVVGRDVLDVGCGTGVIAVMAAMVGGGSVQAVDLASADRLGHILLVDDYKWGLACDSIGDVVWLTKDEVKWRQNKQTRPWLAGTSLQHLCAIMDTEVFANMLNNQA